LVASVGTMRTIGHDLPGGYCSFLTPGCPSRSWRAEAAFVSWGALAGQERDESLMTDEVQLKNNRDRVQNVVRGGGRTTWKHFVLSGKAQ
jgi:hypothetical protein